MLRFRPRRRGRDFPNHRGEGATKNQFHATKTARRNFSDQGGEGATFQTIAETVRPIINSTRPIRRRRDFLAKTETALLFSPRRRVRDFPDHRGEGAIKNQFHATKTDTTQLFRLSRSGRDFPDHRGEGATKNQFHATKTARRNFSD